MKKIIFDVARKAISFGNEILGFIGLRKVRSGVSTTVTNLIKGIKVVDDFIHDLVIGILLPFGISEKDALYIKNLCVGVIFLFIAYRHLLMDIMLLSSILIIWHKKATRRLFYENNQEEELLEEGEYA